MPRTHHKGEVWRYHDKVRVRLREDTSGWWFRDPCRKRYAQWIGPYTTEEQAYEKAVLLITTGFAGEVEGGS